MAPRIHSSAFIADTARILGDVEIGADSSVWFNAIVRGDVHWIRIGKRTNIQDLCMVHVTKGKNPTTIEDEVTVGHGAVLHGCHVKSRALIGIGAVVLDGAVVESHSVIGAGAVVAPGTHVPSGVLMVGVPAKPKRELTPEEIRWIEDSAQEYVDTIRMYR